MLPLNQYNTGKKSLALLLMTLLILLTSINFLLYPEKVPSQEMAMLITNGPDDRTDDLPEKTEAAPLESDEKAPGNPVSFSEEYLHEGNDPGTLNSNNLVHQLILVCSKMAPVHFEVIIPPPNTIC